MSASPAVLAPPATPIPTPAPLGRPDPAARAWSAADTAWVAGLGLVLALLLGGLVSRQGLEKDEGYLSAASWLVAQGGLPYRDFVFPQQPYFPLLHAPVAWLWGPSLTALRVPAALAFAALGGLVLLAVQRHDRDPRLARWAAALFCFNTVALFWYPRCRQYAVADLLLFASFLLVAEGRTGVARSNRGTWLAALAGLLAGGGLHVRMLMAPAVVVLAVAAARSLDGRWSWRRFRAFAASLLAASIPFALVAARAPAEWLYQTAVLQTRLRPPFEAAAMLRRAAEVVVEFVAPGEVAVLCLLAMAGGLAWARGARPPNPTRRLAAQMLVVLAGTALLCHPAQAQYLVQALPYLVLVAAGPWGRVLARTDRARRPSVRLAMALLLVAAVAAGSRRAVLRIVNDPGRPELSMARLAEYQRFMDSRAADGQTLLTWWPGYLLVHHVARYPGAELGRPTDRGVGTMSEAEYRAHGLRHPREIEADLRAGRPHWVVVGQGTPPGAEAWLGARYALRAAFGEIRVYERSNG